MTDMVRNLLADNPQFQQIIQNNPDLGHILSDPRIIQQTLEMVQNPNMFNELMRNHDQAIRNIQVCTQMMLILLKFLSFREFLEVKQPFIECIKKSRNLWWILFLVILVLVNMRRIILKRKMALKMVKLCVKILIRLIFSNYVKKFFKKFLNLLI